MLAADSLKCYRPQSSFLKAFCCLHFVIPKVVSSFARRLLCYSASGLWNELQMGLEIPLQPTATLASAPFMQAYDSIQALALELIVPLYLLVTPT